MILSKWLLTHCLLIYTCINLKVFLDCRKSAICIHYKGDNSSNSVYPCSFYIFMAPSLLPPPHKNDSLLIGEGNFYAIVIQCILTLCGRFFRERPASHSFCFLTMLIWLCCGKKKLLYLICFPEYLII